MIYLSNVRGTFPRNKMVYQNLKWQTKKKKSNRGLASADEETRERVASEGGKASHKND